MADHLEDAAVRFVPEMLRLKRADILEPPVVG
jgi:hypothetical protein